MSSLTRARLLQGAAATAILPLTAGTVPILSPGLLRRLPALLPRPYSATALAAMHQLGIVSITEAGYEHYNNGRIARPLCDEPEGRRWGSRAGHAVPACDCNNGNGNCGPGDPGGGNSGGYPVIGQVAVNYTNGSGYSTFNGAIFIGDFSPGGPHFGMPQKGLGPIYKFIGAADKCVEAHLTQILGSMAAIAAAIQKYGVARWGVPLVQGLASSILSWGPIAGWGPSAAADFILTVFADIAATEVLEVFIAAGLVGGVATVLWAVLDCIASL